VSSNGEYGVRYCAFVDILGFRELINGLGKGALSVNEMQDFLTTVHKPDGMSTHGDSAFNSELRITGQRVA
jgi:hypothetical protein